MGCDLCYHGNMKNMIKDMKLWDYKLEKNWAPQTDEEWIWFLERKINYDNWKGLDPIIIKKYFNRIKIHPGKRFMLEYYFKKYAQ